VLVVFSNRMQKPTGAAGGMFETQTEEVVHLLHGAESFLRS